MEGYKPEGSSNKHEGAVKNFLKIAALMGALGGAYGSAHAHSFDQLPTEAGNLDAQEDTAEVFEDTVEAILQKAIDGKPVTGVEANAVRYAWEEASEYLPQEVTTGEYGQTMAQMLSKLDEIVRVGAEDVQLKSEFASLNEDLATLENEPEIVALKQGIDPFAEEDVNAVEILSENK
jgi:hypothetical protein